jgi:hypothetical protein
LSTFGFFRHFLIHIGAKATHETGLMLREANLAARMTGHSEFDFDRENCSG